MNIIYIHIYIYIQLLLCQSGNTPYDRLQGLVSVKTRYKSWSSRSKTCFESWARESQCRHNIQQILSYNKNLTHNPTPPPPASFCSSIFQYQANVFQKTKRIFSTVSFPSHVLGRVGLFLCACFRLCPAEAGFWSRSFSTQFLFQALILLAHALIFITQCGEMNEEFALRCRHWVYFGGVMAPPQKKRHSEAAKQSGVDRSCRSCRVLLVCFFVCW